MAPQPKRFAPLRTLGIFVASVTAVYMGLTAYENQDNLIRTFIMPAVRRLPVEMSHNLALLACKYRINPVSQHLDDYNLNTSFFGRLISNPIGIAAGFDRNAEALHGLKDLGFGFIEIGSVTPMAQKGNGRTRLFGLYEDRKIMGSSDGFDSDGHYVVMQRLRRALARNDFKAIVGVNLGSNRSSTTPTRDYATGVKTFGPVADFLVVNATSASTASGQPSWANKKQLIEVLTAVNNARSQLQQRKTVPILLKLSPDMTLDEMKDTAAVISMRKCRVEGLIVANSTATRDNLSPSLVSHDNNGALSGAPLRERSTKQIARMYELTKGSVTIVGVGGISSGRDAFEKIQAGASFVQLYTALVYEGPDLVDRIKGELSMLLKESGYANVRDAVGSNYKQYLPGK
ncbi:dihydroorotate dehydrogenase (quinone), mitochondrial-like [Drosophila albomicans]|uniref:Dihydroorotate dehydrogenase (quinone), mitochondrial n=1 Tax=Drosophila albomicans TaxID=7291 RepID=A0A6P8ZER0_DROAB|nr:dihydroorotate dehydrogenase (quinone), mitochondrial-like [Drosophila albomicans]